MKLIYQLMTTLDIVTLDINIYIPPCQELHTLILLIKLYYYNQ